MVSSSNCIFCLLIAYKVTNFYVFQHTPAVYNNISDICTEFLKTSYANKNAYTSKWVLTTEKKTWTEFVENVFWIYYFFNCPQEKNTPFTS